MHGGVITKKQDVNALPARVSDANSNISQRQSVRLPKLIIEKFYDVSMWQEFWSQYETTIHKNDLLCNKDKFTYLKTYLTGTAAKAGLMLTVTMMMMQSVCSIADLEGNIL